MQQDWCNGRIGSMGLSYAAHTQLAAACLNPPGLTTMVLDSGGFANAYRCGARQGGAFELKQATWAYKQAALSPLAKANPQIAAALAAENIFDWFACMPWQPQHSPLRHHPEYEEYLLQQWRSGAFGEYWQQLGIYAEGWYAQLPDIPVMFLSSWYDAYVPFTLANFHAFCAAGRQAPQRLIMGPWLHGDRIITHSGNAEFGAQAALDGAIAPTGSPAALTGSAATFAPRHPNRTAGAKSPSSSWAAAAANAMTPGGYNTAASGTTRKTGHSPAAVANDGICRRTWDCARKRRQQRRTSFSPTRITRCRPSAAPSPPACRSLPGARSTSAKRRNSLAARATTCRFPPAPTCWSSRANH